MSAQSVQQSILNKNRKDKFLLVLNLPDILKKQNKVSAGDRSTDYLNQDSLQYSVYGTIVPKTSIPAVDVPYGAQVPKMTSYSRPAWEPITVNFTVDNGFNNWWVLWYWLNVINNSTQSRYNAEGLSPGESIIANRTTTYQTDITVYGLDEYNNKKIEFNYLHAFITGLGEIAYSYRDPDQIESSFTFEFGQLEAKLL
jgi:hypothetical protein